MLLEKDPARRFQSPAELLKVMPMVRDAIKAGSLLMKTIRVFVSSTGDVQKERILADRAIRSVAGEFNVPVSVTFSNFQRLAEENGESKTESENHETLMLCPYFLEYQRFQSDAGWRGPIPNTAEFDLVISILWSRLGACLDPSLDDAGWQFTRLGNGIRSCLGAGPRKKEWRRSAIARLSQLFEADTAVGAKRGVRSLYSAMELLTGVLCALGKEQRGKLRRDVQ